MFNIPYSTTVITSINLVSQIGDRFVTNFIPVAGNGNKFDGIET